MMNKNINKINLNEIITPGFVKKLRLKLKLTQKQLASILGISLQTVKKWEQSVNPIEGISARMLYILNDDVSIFKKYFEL